MDASETSMSKRLAMGLVTALLAGCILHGPHGEDSAAVRDFGHPAAPQEIALWNLDVGPSGEGLPAGRGTVSEGATVYAAKCAKCHGASGIEGPMDRLVGGRETLTTSSPLKTIGSYWPYAPTLYDYIHRAMPYDAPQSLTAEEVYAVTAWLLHRNGIVPEDAVMDAHTLPAVEMPNRHGFVPDPRPDLASP